MVRWGESAPADGEAPGAVGPGIVAWLVAGGSRRRPLGRVRPRLMGRLPAPAVRESFRPGLGRTDPADAGHQQAEFFELHVGRLGTR